MNLVDRRKFEYILPQSPLSKIYLYVRWQSQQQSDSGQSLPHIFSVMMMTCWHFPIIVIFIFFLSLCEYKIQFDVKRICQNVHCGKNKFFVKNSIVNWLFFYHRHFLNIHGKIELWSSFAIFHYNLRSWKRNSWRLLQSLKIHF